MRTLLDRVPAWWSSWSLPRRIAVVAVLCAAAVLGAVLAVTATRGPAPVAVPPLAPTPTGPSTPTNPSTPAAPSAPTGALSPLTGLPGGAGRILAVKVDNALPARPQTGLGSADVVYAIEVEGGLSRFLAVYDSDHLPPGDRIGPVRSARESDLPILQQYGRVDFAYSGALTRFLPVLAAADVVNASPEQDASAFLRGSDRAAPYNEYVVPSAVLARFPDSAPAQDVGFRFGDAPPGGVATATATARMPSASFTFTWSAAEGRYLVAFDGKPALSTDGGQLGAPTVVIQEVAETTSPRGFMDSPGVLSPYAPTEGSGAATVLRDGRAYQGSWSRPDAAAGTSFTFGGQPMPFHPGPVWIVLEPAAP
ncbi:hypothetical protein GCM10010441_57170 [Kitasatospora paracochleata]|uniref:DUF3048 domain-containing protein n=1 Tax=Kitasatospora paracochleata TaxID=58354 RepID=A0ABT1IUB1_9ACTN|nr:DUF3048 domain-containing protein [Kitasatospora paracochleata]MCP2308659.1 hypothetical protein [Kitasatospora paracochleata]